MVVQTFNLMNLVFIEILKFSPTVLAKYASLTDKLLYLILVPHVVLLLFLFSFGILAAKGHRGFQMLISITGYLVIILSGWYGQFLAPLISGFFLLWIVIAFIGFIAVRIAPPIYGPGIRSLGGALAGKLSEKTIGKTNSLKALNKQKDEVEKVIKALEADAPDSSASPEEKTAYRTKMQDLKVLKAQIEHKISEIEG